MEFRKNMKTRENITHEIDNQSANFCNEPKPYIKPNDIPYMSSEWQCQISAL